MMSECPRTGTLTAVSETNDARTTKDCGKRQAEAFLADTELPKPDAAVTFYYPPNPWIQPSALYANSDATAQV
jgi:hypothetical protein